MSIAQRLGILVAALLGPIACASHGADAGARDGRFTVPDGLSNLPRDGEVGVKLTLVAFTLRQGEVGLELYASVRNDGDTPACATGMITDFVGKNGQIVTSAASAVLSKQIYRVDQNTIIGCIDPGEVGMSASMNLPAELVIGDLGTLRHAFPTFRLDGIVPINAFAVSQVATVAKTVGNSYAGTFDNKLDVALSAPSVTIFPVNRVGRPLGAATIRETVGIPPGGSWAFETNAVNDLGVDHVDFPAASLPPLE